MAAPPLPPPAPVVPHPRAPVPLPRPGWGRLLIGCAIAGGLLILAGLAALLAGMYWLTSPGRQYATAAVASPQTQGVIHVGDLATDPGARALLTAFFRRAQEAGASDGPQLPAWMRNFQAQQARQGIGQWLPREATVSLEPDAENVGRVVLAANLRGFVRPIRLAVMQAAKGDKKSRITRHGDHEVLGIAGGMSVCFMDGTLVVSDHPDAMDAALDRLSAAASAPAGPHPLPGQWDVHGWLAPGAATVALMRMASNDEDDPEPLGPVPAGLRDLRFGLDVETAEQARVSAEAAFESADAAAAARSWLADAVAAWTLRMEASGVTIRRSETAEGERIRYDVELSGLDGAIGRALDRQERARREGQDR